MAHTSRGAHITKKLPFVLLIHTSQSPGNLRSSVSMDYQIREW